MPRKGMGAKAQRTDLNKPPIPKVQAPKASAQGQPFGAAAEQLRAQQVVPLPNNAAPPSPTATAGGGAAPAGPAPGQFGAFDRPSERPDEHVLTGLDSAPPAQAFDPVLEELKAIYSAYPNDDVLALIEDRMGKAGET